MVKTWHSEPTKKLICNTHTGQYLTDSGKWTGDEDKAKNFRSVFQAVEFCCQCQLTDVELVFKFGDGPYQASIPLSDCSTNPETAIAHLLQLQELSFDD